MEDFEYIKKYFNKVDTLTATYISTTSWTHGDYDVLTIGKSYKVSHIGVLRSSTNIMLEDFPGKSYNSVSFHIFENGELIDGSKYTHDPRFLAPYLKWHYKYHSWYKDGMSNNVIPMHLTEVEKEYDVKVLFAVESGSRAWGFESRNSDWDVRFIYVHKLSWYLSIEEQRDVIEHVYDDEVDLVGWDLKKALTLLRRSNPSLLEWLHSPTVYYADDEFVKRIAVIESLYFNPIKSMYHYNRIYNKHNEHYLQKEDCSMKRYLYYLRGILACKWIERNKSIPPVLFSELMDKTIDDESIKSKVHDLIILKKQGRECDLTVVDKELMDYSKHQADYYNSIIGDFRPDINKVGADSLDKLLYDMVTKESRTTNIDR